MDNANTTLQMIAEGKLNLNALNGKNFEVEELKPGSVIVPFKISGFDDDAKKKITDAIAEENLQKNFPKAEEFRKTFSAGLCSCLSKMTDRFVH